MKRRSAIKVMAAGVVAEPFSFAQQRMVQIAMAPERYKLQFFTASQNALVDRLSEMILPADDHSPGASQARVSLFADLILASSGKDAQTAWTSGLSTVEMETVRRFQQPFLKCSSAQQDEIVAAMAANEGKPATALEEFFAPLKQMTVNGYYTSSLGIHQDLEYRGNTALPAFVGCKHPEGHA